jgi:hypothetical protein
MKSMHAILYRYERQPQISGMPEAQALLAIVLDPQKGCQPLGADNLFKYGYDFRSQRFSLWQHGTLSLLCIVFSPGQAKKRYTSKYAQSTITSTSVNYDRWPIARAAILITTY